MRLEVIVQWIRLDIVCLYLNVKITRLVIATDANIQCNKTHYYIGNVNNPEIVKSVPCITATLSRVFSQSMVYQMT